MTLDREREVDANFEWFEQQLPQLLPRRSGMVALLRHRQIEDFFASAAGALAAGRERFADGLFSIQEVTDRPADLGFFSHAIDTRAIGPSPAAR